MKRNSLLSSPAWPRSIMNLNHVRKSTRLSSVKRAESLGTRLMYTSNVVHVAIPLTPGTENLGIKREISTALPTFRTNPAHYSHLEPLRLRDILRRPQTIVLGYEFTQEALKLQRFLHRENYPATSLNLLLT